MENLKALIQRQSGNIIYRFASIKKLLNFDKILKISLFISAALVLGIVLGFVVTLCVASFDFLKSLGFSSLLKDTWNPLTDEFGASPFIFTTILVSSLSLLLSIPFSLSIAISLSDKKGNKLLQSFLNTSLDLMAAVPSVIYGFWALFTLSPLVRLLQTKLGFAPMGVGLFTAVIVLTIMIIPFSAGISREVIKLVPQELEEAGYSLGATRYEVIRSIILPQAKSGIIAGFILSMGRSLGETMAVTMVIGNFNAFPKNIFSPANTISSLIANQFNEASGLHQSALIFLGLILLVITLLVNLAGAFILKGSRR
ncbi:MAG TPA: phosphate ABC transporter permease subunit PstC [Candidatus Hydrothermia bacterium]|nr:phosphate ABC transporter permease subunit PstC [Candidatus Hydrothermia bacterium]HOK23283.1 phosphate ABC transporter permease subunit PstC [Candidatus Hydrothermia bacterium]HOL24092.1 phosphate ABC transporter permease subunit PstC [Candidatus Hydrothermia bacterium]HPO78992.1 phosphate ABC transporter permease subunit PstC [Candidatus Hydrothermia bacterium]